MAIEWREAMSIDGGPIDDDHRFWMKLASDIDLAFENGVNRDAILEFLKKFKYYTLYHFVREEAIQKEIGYPYIEQHAEKHKQLVSVVDNAVKLFEQDISDDKSERLRNDVARLLNAWIVGHIVKQDMPMRDYIRMHRKGPYRGPITTI